MNWHIEIKVLNEKGVIEATYRDIWDLGNMQKAVFHMLDGTDTLESITITPIKEKQNGA